MPTDLHQRPASASDAAPSGNAPRIFRKKGRACLIAYKCVVFETRRSVSARYHVWNPARVSERSEWEHGLPPAGETVVLTPRQFFALTEAAPQTALESEAAPARPRRRRPLAMAA